MGPAIFVLAILGCGEADAPCQQVSIVNTAFSSEAACGEATGDAVERNQDIPYPVVVAECRRADAKTAAQLMPADVQLPEPQRGPASIPVRVQRVTYEAEAPQRG